MSEKNLTRRQFIAAAGAAAVSLPFVSLERSFASDERPNFVFILIDDMRWDAMSCMGHPFLRTPNIDRIAREGARFANAFCTTSLCSPSRASFLTGRYVHSHGVKDNKTPLSDDIPTFPRVLQSAGYDTAFIGKWHMDGQEGPRPGINHWVSFKGQGDYYDPKLNVDGKMVRPGAYMTDVLTKYAVDWIEKPRTSPFCLYLSHKAVHAGFVPAVRHSKLYSDVEIVKPDNFDETYEGKPKWIRNRKTRAKAGPGHDEFVRNYNRTLVGVDESVGRVLAALEKAGALDNTVVVFAGDNGFYQGEHGMQDKRSAYEESIRIPFLMRYPKLIKPGTKIDPLVLNIDLCPTFLDLAGAKTPEGVQGRSFVPLLKGRNSGWREDFLYEYFKEPPFVPPTMRGVRTERWKYVEYPDLNDIPELYDLKNDPKEMKNLAEDPAYAKVLVDMRARLKRLIAETK